MLLQLSSYLNLFTFAFVVLSSFFGADGIVPSPKASTELICPTDRATDCYPSTFQPTEEFQIVKDEQALPPGLHVRMNLATGVKEAKLNIPEPEEAYSDLVVVEKPEETEDIPPTENVDGVSEDSSEYSGVPHHHDQSVLSRPSRIRYPPSEPAEALTFETSMSTLRDSPGENYNLDPALCALQDLCHSGEWGLKLTKDSKVIRLLVQVFQDVSQQLAIRSGAALLLATAIQNNPEALAAALSHFYNDEWPTGPLDAILVALAHEQSPKLLIRTVFLLSSLCQNPQQLARFINAGGLETLLQVFEAAKGPAPEDAKLRGKIANFILDHVVDLNLDARLTQARDVDNGETRTASQMEGEDDSWIIVGGRRSIADPIKVEHILKGWEAAFETAEQGLGQRNSHEAVTAYESVESARRALAQRPAYMPS